jgi:Trypsin/PEP-CTERM motif
MKRIAGALVLASACAVSAQATVVSRLEGAGLTQFVPVIEAGAPPDSPAARVDPNVLSSPFTGVVSINIRYDGLSFICSGAAIDPWHVISAGHCVDTTGLGTVIDITQPGNDVRVVVNDDGVFDTTTDLITANEVVLNPDYQGFGVCPFAADFQCLNDDISIIRLSQALPSTVQTYQIYDQPAQVGDVFTMVGYGTSGDGINGYTVSPSFFVKRDGANVFDIFDTNDEAFFDPASAAEVWYYDFDGVKNGVNRDALCELIGVCGTSLGNNIETAIGGGDSGGPSFIRTSSGDLMLVANNDFSGNVFWGTDTTDGDFGDIGGGVLFYPYLDWIRATAVPEPNPLALVAFGLVALVGARRRLVRN